jgi:drug/metabolite transporter (DMT)-like permease
MMRQSDTQTSATARAMPAAAWLGMFIVALVWGGSFVAIRVAVREVPVLSLVALRVLGASVVLLIYLRLSGLRFPRGRQVWLALLVQSFVGYTVPFLLIGWGQKYLTSGLASILNASTAVFGVLIAAAVLKDERLSRQRGLGVALGFGGVAVAMGIENLAALDLTSLAQLALLGASMSYALSNAWNRAKLRGVDPRLVAGITLSLAAAQMVPVALIYDGLPAALWSPASLGAIAYLAVMSTALAYLVYYRVLALAGAGNASLVTLLVVPVAIVLGALILGEQLAPRDYLGFALLALGLLIIDGRLPMRR